MSIKSFLNFLKLLLLFILLIVDYFYYLLFCTFLLCYSVSIIPVCNVCVCVYTVSPPTGFFLLQDVCDIQQMF